MKSEEFLDEGIGDWWRQKVAPAAAQKLSPLARSGWLGATAKNIAQVQTAQSQEQVGFTTNFVKELQTEFNKSLQSGLLQEFSLKNYSNFDLVLESVIKEQATPMSIEDWLETIMNRKVSQYHIDNIQRQEYEKYKKDFAQEFNANKKFPTDVAKNLGDWLYRLAISQQRDPSYRNKVDLPKGVKPGLSSATPSQSGPKVASTYNYPNVPQGSQNVTANIKGHVYTYVPSTVQGQPGTWYNQANQKFTDEASIDALNKAWHDSQKTP